MIAPDPHCLCKLQKIETPRRASTTRIARPAGQAALVWDIGALPLWCVAVELRITRPTFPYRLDHSVGDEAPRPGAQQQSPCRPARESSLLQRPARGGVTEQVSVCLQQRGLRRSFSPAAPPPQQPGAGGRQPPATLPVAAGAAAAKKGARAPPRRRRCSAPSAQRPAAGAAAAARKPIVVCAARPRRSPSLESRPPATHSRSTGRRSSSARPQAAAAAGGARRPAASAQPLLVTLCAAALLPRGSCRPAGTRRLAAAVRVLSKERVAAAPAAGARDRLAEVAATERKALIGSGRAPAGGSN